MLRKTVAIMTAEGSHNIPHAGCNYEPDVTDFWTAYQALRKSDPRWTHVTANSLILYVITQGLIACPRMNGHTYFSLRSATGKTKFYSNIDITVPMVMPDGGMMTFNLRNCERRGPAEIQAGMDELRQRLDNSNLLRVLIKPSAEDTLRRLLRGRVDLAFLRCMGNILGPGRLRFKVFNEGKDKVVPPESRLRREDIELGTIAVTNIGAVYRGAYTPPVMTNLIPPQIAVVGVSGLVERPGVVTHADGSKEIAPRLFLPFHLVVDHRALDCPDLVPFMKCLDGIFARPEAMRGWISSPQVDIQLVSP